jgi:integrase/recombinase XerD
MSALADAARDYLRLRNSLGHDLAEYHRELPRFVEFLEAEGLPAVTIAAALAWAQGPGVDPATSIAPRRMTIARGFARYMAGIDARTEVPPPGLIAGRRRWRPPFVYSPGDIEALMAQARQLRPMPAATHETLTGLLAATGMWVGEAIRLDRADIDWTGAVLTIRESKFGKSRMMPVLGSTLIRLERYARTRDRLCPQAATAGFFVSTAGTRLIYACVGQAFRRVRDHAGIGAGADHPPRIHDLRHTFAVHTQDSGIASDGREAAGREVRATSARAFGALDLGCLSRQFARVIPLDARSALETGWILTGGGLVAAR